MARIIAWILGVITIAIALIIGSIIISSLISNVEKSSPNNETKEVLSNTWDAWLVIVALVVGIPIGLLALLRARGNN